MVCATRNIARMRSGVFVRFTRACSNVAATLGRRPSTFAVALLVTLALGGTATAQAQQPVQLPLDGPLTLSKEGSFFVGGDTRAVAPNSDITVNQMYVQYQVPASIASQPKPAVVMIHGCCLSAKSWEETPDGRMGWSEYFVRRGYPTYLPDQVTRARSGFDPTVFQQVRTGAAPPDSLPNILAIDHQAAWTSFRFGPTYGTAYPDEQFPVNYADEFYKQMIPDLNLMLGPYSGPNPTFNNLATLANQTGGAVLIGHSESGFFPENAALIDAGHIRGMVTIEPGGSCTTANPLSVPLTQDQIVKLAKIPTLIVYGDHLSGGFVKSYADCHDTYMPQIVAAGGDITFVSLPDMGITGNSHMMMLDRNNLDIADIIMGWIDSHT
jgi:pimeloyl-ACP methyl ester carboxylesterase